ncbi:MAG: hypothetical protein IT488_00030 [Gammaproteobacteria bacterium]|nr:hypothetical protein [Gammaproteobacteria bacterium]
MRRQLPRFSAAVIAGLCLVSGPLQAAKISDVSNTKHNFSATVKPVLASGERTASATSESQICAFCHTPHGATDE